MKEYGDECTAVLGRRFFFSLTDDQDSITDARINEFSMFESSTFTIFVFFYFLPGHCILRCGYMSVQMPTLFSSSLWYTLLGRLMGHDASEYTERWDIASRRSVIMIGYCRRKYSNDLYLGL